VSEHDDTAEGCDCKIGRIVDRYDLQNLNDDLAADWTGAAGERRSLRKLAREVDRRVLRTAMDRAGMEYRDGEVENVYRILTDDDVSSGSRTETRRELEHASVPIEQVERDFVSHQTVHTHLTDCLEVSMEEPDDAERIENARDTLRALQNRTVAVTDDTIGRLDGAGALSVGEYSVLVDVTIVCEDCGGHYTVGELLDAEGCDCADE